MTTLAGGTESGAVDGKGSDARFNGPNGLDIGPDGNLYVADTGNNSIRKVTPDGEVTTIAGSVSGYADGQAKSAQFHSPFGLAAAPNGTIFVADTGNNCIRQIRSDGQVTTVAGSTDKGLADDVGSGALFNRPFSIALDANGGIFVADAGNHAIRRIDMTNTARPKVETVVGGAVGFQDGLLADARLNTPNDVAFGPNGALYVADFGNNCIRVVDLSKGTVDTVAGGAITGFRNAQGRAAAFNAPTGLCVDSRGDIYVADNQNHRIRIIDASGMAGSVAGQRAGFVDATNEAAQFYEPTDVAVGKDGSIFVADTRNNRIRRIKRIN